MCEKNNAVNLLEDIVNEFKDKEQITLSLDRVKEILSLLKKENSWIGQMS